MKTVDVTFQNLDSSEISLTDVRCHWSPTIDDLLFSQMPQLAILRSSIAVSPQHVCRRLQVLFVFQVRFAAHTWTMSLCSAQHKTHEEHKQRLQTAAQMLTRYYTVVQQTACGAVVRPCCLSPGRQRSAMARLRS